MRHWAPFYIPVLATPGSVPGELRTHPRWPGARLDRPGAGELQQEAEGNERRRQDKNVAARRHRRFVGHPGAAHRLIILHFMQSRKRVIAGADGAEVAQMARAFELFLGFDLPTFVEKRQPPLAKQQRKAGEVKGRPPIVSQLWIIDCPARARPYL